MKKNVCFLFLLFSISLCFAKVGDKMYVAVKSADLYSSNSFFAKKVSKLNYSDEVEVLKEDNNWIEIKSTKNAAKTGWINVDSLSKRKIISSSFTASTDELALAGKGFNEEIEKAYKKSGKTDYKSVDIMENNSISSSELKEFISEGELKGDIK